VLILDFYYKSTELILLANKAKSVTVLDHHKTSLHELQVAKHLASGDIEYVWANDLSGVGVTWNTFYPGMPMPKLLAHIQDRDLWKFELEGTKVINAALFNTAINPRTFAHWDKLIIIDPEYALVELADAGEILLSDLYARSNALIDNACEISIIYRNDDGALDDAKGIAINATSDYASELGNLALCDNLSDTYAAIWFYTGSEVQVSLRSKGDYDVSRIAKHHGGGGHKNAASFRVSLNELLIWLDQNPQ
jgi:oligoribonuclease NrnB/cAMP/cGMP phosphodiesterase (DHH superfamily)